MTVDQKTDAIRWLKAVVGMVIAIALAVVWIAIPVTSTTPRLVQLILAIIPEAIVVPVTAAVLYWLWKRGVASEQLKPNHGEVESSEIKSVAERVGDIVYERLNTQDPLSAGGQYVGRLHGGGKTGE